MSDRKVKLQEIADILKISKGTVFKVVHENLSMKKLYSKWMLRLLTVQQRIHDSERCLKLFTRNEKDFLRRYITINETWIHDFYTRVEKSVSWVERRGRKPAKASAHTIVSRQGHGLCILGHAWNFAHRLSSEAPDDPQRLLHCLIGSIGRRNQEVKASHGKEETAVSTRQCTGP